MAYKTLYLSLINSPLGIIELLANETHLVSLSFEEAPKHQSRKQKEKQTKQYISEKTDLLLQVEHELIEYFEGKRQVFEFPFEQQGTDFQQKVWQLLVEIPYSETTSYLALSKKYGDEKAIRAVATANGANQLGIIVPCHRVIGSNGKLIGYAGELWRKEWLLAHERKHGSKEIGQLSLL